MKLVHISDIHLTVPGERMGGLDPHARFAAAITHINLHHADAVRLIITGDLAHWGEAAAYEALKAVLDQQAIPVRLMIGNHDDRSTFRRVFGDHPVDQNGYVNHAETIEQTRFIYLDTVQEKTHAGHFGADRLEWLRSELDAAQSARIFMHHNPMRTGVPAKDLIALIPEHRAGFAALIQEYRDRIDFIHFGHVHAPIHGTFRGVPFASVPSTGNQSMPDMAEPELLQGAPREPSYCVIGLHEGDTTIHQIPFAWDGPVFAVGTGWSDWAKPVSALP
jgi:3',5'-cyclic AMP phosphodiesterase CpdA